ncbi:DNA-3-methyladenine glycosylase [Candidatus Oleimmundimicrobium sp.]|uniref:DNA-3-methyladenine glycosylase n=1 Tax=Candidatus Oleimmundimicrobium sp. TaxID=3060597 RepID=UPI0027270E4F|nr:DNA-3-methyladenine glycosylase [Candidatus Oleimmundimicrobium sp.]MDO8886120.1 DNA-3-methyladenine glycosylase [Candidatus Oleimmundimicrobium sp.]
MEALKRDFYERNTKVVAKELLGKVLVHRLPEGDITGRIVETEAYFGNGDPASHASRGKTPRNAIMFGPSGHAYVYFNYGMHYLFNIVTEKKGIPGAVLIRALEPIEGIDFMLQRRKTKKLRCLTNGPAKLTQALGIDISHNGLDLVNGEIFVCDDKKAVFKVASASRIGISVGKDELLRFYIKDNQFVSTAK